MKIKFFWSKYHYVCVCIYIYIYIYIYTHIHLNKLNMKCIKKIIKHKIIYFIKYIKWYKIYIPNYRLYDNYLNINIQKKKNIYIY